jgi:hypothetical protein
MIPSDKRIAQLVKKLSGKAVPKPNKIKFDKEEHDQEISRASADDIFREMKKLPFSG